MVACSAHSSAVSVRSNLLRVFKAARNRPLTPPTERVFVPPLSLARTRKQKQATPRHAEHGISPEDSSY
jgi:hypothetical protein